MLSALESVVANPRNGITTTFSKASAPGMNPALLAREIMDFYPHTLKEITCRGKTNTSNDDKIH